MPICNIVDNRKNKYQYRRINAIVEATWHDNSCEGADLAPNDSAAPDFRERENISVAEALAWANEMPGDVTLFLWSEGDGTTIAKEEHVA